MAFEQDLFGIYGNLNTFPVSPFLGKPLFIILLPFFLPLIA